MTSLLHHLRDLSVPALWALFLAENLFITGIVLVAGRWIISYHQEDQSEVSHNSKRDWQLCLLTNVLNTVVTYAGFWLWKHDFIAIEESLSWKVLSDFVILFLAMDFLMYVFHYVIHKTKLYNAVHSLHHEAVNPKPIDLFVLHPVETLAFGGLWLLLLMVYSFSLAAIVLYLIVNVVFGLTGHLGMEPLPKAWRKKVIFEYLGTSSFHHDHHKNLEVNFGFYTSIWDRLFGTLGKS